MRPPGGGELTVLAIILLACAAFGYGAAGLYGALLLPPLAAWAILGPFGLAAVHVKLFHPTAAWIPGQVGVVVQATPALLVHLGDRDWPARCDDPSRMPGYGDRVVVERIEGTTLVVRPEAPPAA